MLFLSRIDCRGAKGVPCHLEKGRRMVKYREILRLRAMGVSQANTAHSCGCAQSTAQEVEKHASAAGLA